MPNASIPHKGNKSINFFDFEINGNSVGDVKLGIPTLPKQVLDIMNAKTWNPKQRRIYLKAPIINLTTLDLHWDVFAWLIGVDVSDISAGTTALATDVPFVIHEEKMSAINNRSYESGVSAGVVLNSAANGVGTTYVEDDDYVVDEVAGKVQCIPTGTNTLADGATVYVESGTLITTASKRIYLGKDPVDCEIANAVLTHDYPKNSAGNIETLIIKLWKADITSDVEIPFGSDGDIGLPMTLTALEDSSQASGQEWGYLDISTS
jgi:hypothetical protein